MKKWGHLLALLILLQTLSAALYLGKAGQFGFPLDDAWIHQAYARNFGLHGMMAFSPGQISTGSTSVGWTLLLAAGYWLRIPFFLWTYFWGAIFAVATALVAACLSQSYFGNFRNAVILAVICMLEWHFAWAALSGMEITLFTFLILLFFLLLKRDTSPLLLGALTGIITLVRPEGMLLVFIYVLKLFLTQPHKVKHSLLHATVFILSFLTVISPWIAFNFTYSHKPFPNTISAKFIRYGYPLSLGKSLRYLRDVLLYFASGQLLLFVPGAILTIYEAVRKKNIIHLYPWVWFAILVMGYSVAQPILPDNGRYLVPFTPLVSIYGMKGLDQLMQKFVHTFALRFTVWFSLFGMAIVLWINGASDYSYRIHILNTVHMQAAQWINAHASQEAVIATHDIGIIGYNTERQIVDLLGLITPEVLPIMDNPPKLAEYLRSRHVSYLVVYSGYYRDLLIRLQARRVFSPGAEQLRAIGTEPFEVWEVGK